MAASPGSPSRITLDVTPEDLERAAAELRAAGDGAKRSFTFGKKTLVASWNSSGRRKGDILQEGRFNQTARALQQHYNELKEKHCAKRGEALGLKSGDLQLGVWTKNFKAFFDKYVGENEVLTKYYYSEKPPQRFDPDARDWWEMHWQGQEKWRPKRDRAAERRKKKEKMQSSCGTSLMTEGVTDPL